MQNWYCNKISIAVMSSFVLATSAAAQSTAGGAWFPEGNNIVPVRNIQRVPTRFNFQARVTQAKMGLEDASVDVMVDLVSGTNVLCREEFKDVRIRNSVLNLTIGAECNLDIHLAHYSDIDLVVCIADANCLKPIALGSVPFALKANMAVQAQFAPRSDVATRSLIAHRASADRRLAGRNEYGIGFFDFYTHPDAGQSLEALSLPPLDQVIYAPYYVTDGFIQWAPVSENVPYRLHICAQDADADLPRRLDEMIIHADMTTLRGDAHVQGDELRLGGRSTAGVAAKVQGVDGQLTLAAEQTTVDGGPMEIANAGILLHKPAAAHALPAGQQACALNTPTLQSEGSLSLCASTTQISGTLDVGGAEVVLSGGTPQTAAVLRAANGNLKVGSPVPASSRQSGDQTEFTGNVKIYGRLDVLGEAYTGGLADGSVAGGHGGVIADRTITSDDIELGAVGANELGIQVVKGTANDGTPGHIAAHTITGKELAEWAVRGSGRDDTLGHIAPATITAKELAKGSVRGSGGSAADGSLAHIAAETITATELARGSVGGDELAIGVVKGTATDGTRGHIQRDTITHAELAQDAVGESEIAANAVGRSELKTDAVRFEVVQRHRHIEVNTEPGKAVGLDAECEEGELLTGGGCVVHSTPPLLLYRSAPLGARTWNCGWSAAEAHHASLYAYAFCGKLVIK